MRSKTLLCALVAGLSWLPSSAPAFAQPACLSVDPMPDGAGHDHTDPAQHAFSCGLDVESHLPLDDLVPEPTMFGEVDLAQGRGVIATAFKEAGFVTFDLTDPARPRPVARFQGPRCEEVVTDVDCGADVKLSSDGRFAFLFTQNTTRAFGPYEDPIEVTGQPIEPGVHVVNLADFSAPVQASFLPVEPFGVHMGAYHTIAGKGYVFTVELSGRIGIYEEIRIGPLAFLVPAGQILTGAHDVFVFDDPSDGHTYLYVPAGYGAVGLKIYDVTSPPAPRQVGSWITPGGGWYTHSAWAFRHDGRRYAYVAPEGFVGAKAGEPGPVWLLDVTDHANPALRGTWTNPAGHRAGDLLFSAHNVWASGAELYLAHYHGGVWRLDWTRVLDGLATRPVELGYHVPNAASREFVSASPRSRFITGFDLLVRPSVWDVVSDGTYAYASDVNGGLFVLRPS